MLLVDIDKNLSILTSNQITVSPIFLGREVVRHRLRIDAGLGDAAPHVQSVQRDNGLPKPSAVAIDQKVVP